MNTTAYKISRGIYTYVNMGDAQDSQLDSVLQFSESFSANLYGQVRLD